MNKKIYGAVLIAAILMLGVQAYAEPVKKVPTLMVYVNTVNDDGGMFVSSNFTVGVVGKEPMPSIFNGNELGTMVTMKNGLYNVRELPISGYNTTYSPGCSGRINLNEVKTCVIINNDMPAFVNVTKHVINDNGGNSTANNFWIQVCCSFASPSFFQGSENGTLVKVAPNIFYQVLESSWTPNYRTTFVGDCSGVVTPGEIKNCTIINDDIPPSFLNVIKHVINDNGGTLNASDFVLDIFGNNPNPPAVTGSETGVNVTISEGFYNVFEFFSPGYNQFSSLDCNGFIAAGEVKTCTITNDDF